MIVIGIFLTYKAGRQYVPGMLMEIYPEMTIILGTLIPVLILRIKHRSQVAEGYLPSTTLESEEYLCRT